MNPVVDRQPAAREGDPVRLHEIANELRRDVIRMVAPTGQGYVQQGLGAADIFATLYFGEMRLDPGDPRWPDRDRLLLSTAHNTAIFYATLARRGLVPAEGLSDYCRDGSPFEINASERVGPMIEATCGSLGQGLSVAAGMALAARRAGSRRRIYVVLGDGELQEGQVWEAAIMAAKESLSNLCLLIDFNDMQVEGAISEVANVEPLADKWRAFGWNTLRIDGNDCRALMDALAAARREDSAPTCIIADTLVGKGVPFLEGQKSHNLKLPPDIAAAALRALG